MLGRNLLLSVLRPCHSLPREIVDAPVVEALKARLDGALGDLMGGNPAHDRRLEPNPFYDFVNVNGIYVTSLTSRHLKMKDVIAFNMFVSQS